MIIGHLENPKLPELYLNQPFKASRGYDYSDDEKKYFRRRT